MKIAVIGTKGLPVQQGGIERYCEELYPRLVERGHSVDLFARPSYVGATWFSQYIYKGVRVIFLPSLPYRGLDATISSALGAIASVFGNYDIIHFHALGPALYTWIPKLCSRVPIIVTCQGLDWQREKWGKLASSLIRLGEKAAVHNADEIVVVSKELQSYFENAYGLKTTYIPNGPGTYATSNPQEHYLQSLNLKPKHYFLFLGRLVPEKRPDLLIQAFNLLKTTDWKLVLAGGISDSSAYISHLFNLAGKNKNIIFAGEVKGCDLAELVREAGLFVLPSALEGLPLSMLEAMQEKVPVLASNIAPHQQLLGAERGWLFESGNVESCAQFLKQAPEKHLELELMAKKAQEHIKLHYSWDKITDKNLAMYTHLAFQKVKCFYGG